MSAPLRQIAFALLAFTLGTAPAARAESLNTLEKITEKKPSQAPVSEESLPAVRTPPAAVTPPPAGTLESYQRKYISFYYRQPESRFNPIFYQRFRDLMPRVKTQRLDAELAAGESLSDVLMAAQAHHQAEAGNEAAQREHTSLRYGDSIVTWSQTRTIAESAFVFQTFWQFTPIRLLGLNERVIEENDKGVLDSNKVPYGAFTESRTVKKERTNSDTGKTEEVDARQLVYWEVKSGASLNLNLQIFQLSGERPQLYERTGNSWSFDSETVVTVADVQAAFGSTAERDLDPHEDTILALPRFQALTREDPEAVYGSEAAFYLSIDPLWPSGLVNSLMRRDEFKLKAQVADYDPAADWLQAAFGAGETPASLHLQRRDWYQLRETRTEGETSRQVSLGHVQVRGFAPDLAVLQPLDLQRAPELGDQLIELPGFQNSLSFGLGVTGWGAGWGPNVMARAAVPLDRLRASAEAALPASNWESDLAFEVNGSLTALGALSADAQLGGWWRHYWRQFFVSLGLSPLVSYDALPGGAEQYGLGLQTWTGLGWRFSPSVSAGLDLGLRMTWPTGPGAYLRGYTSLHF
ncbi:MAG: hypothetical protein ACO1RX_18595 [Candidatus Sericytochromatia bacterium]